MHSDWFNGIDILQGRWQHGEKVGYCYPSGIEKTLCKRELYVPLITKGLMGTRDFLTGRVATGSYHSPALIAIQCLG
jgi:hypothetical protein